MINDENIGSAEAKAVKRRERILQLKNKVSEKNEDSTEDTVLSTVLQSHNQLSETISKTSCQLKDEESVNIHSNDSDKLDLNKLARRKTDWDLKRGIQKKLQILQNETNNIIAELVAERMKVED